jgi:hypothetical protein
VHINDDAALGHTSKLRPNAVVKRLGRASPAPIPLLDSRAPIP